MNSYIVRQAILNKEEKIIAFSLKFSLPGTYNSFSEVMNKILDIGADRLLAKTFGFIQVDSTIATKELVQTIPKKYFSIVYKIDSYIIQRILGKMKELNEQSYKLTLYIDDIEDLDLYENYFNYFTYLELNSQTLSKDDIKIIVEKSKYYTLEVFVSNIKTQDLFEYCQELNVRLFQGNYISKPFTSEDNEILPEYKVLIDLLNLLDSEASTSKIADYFFSYPKLTISLLEFLNSASLFLKVNIQSINHAISLLGRKQIRRWLLITAYSKTIDNSDLFVNPLLNLAQNRSGMMAYLAKLVGEDEHQAAFIGGLSLLEALMKVPIKKILNELALDNSIKNAVLNYEGELGLLLELVLFSEEVDFENINNNLKLLGISDKAFQEALSQSYVQKE